MLSSFKIRSALAALACSVSVHTIAEPAKPVDVPAGELIAALESLARQSGVEFIYAADELKGLHTQGVHGNLTAQRAVAKLLDGTNITITVHRSGAILLTVARAQPGVPPQSDEKQPDALEEVVVTATKRSENINDVAGGVSAISGTALEDRGASSLEDYIAFIPGISLQSLGTPGYGVVSIRGIAPQSVGASIATYIDEIPVGASGNSTRSGFFTADLDPSDLQRVEVLKGPQGTLYGASSMGGVIKYVTRDPGLSRLEVRTSEDLSVVEHGDSGVKVRSSLSAPLVEGVLGLRLSGYYRHDPGFTDDIGFGGGNMGRTNNLGGRATLLFKPTDDLSVKVKAMAQKIRTIGFSVVDYDEPGNEPAYGPFQSLRYAREGFDEDARLYSAEIRYSFARLDLVSATSYSQVLPTTQSDVTEIAILYGFPLVDRQHPLVDIAHDDTDKLTQELRLVSQRMGAVEWMVGGFYQHERGHFNFYDQLTADPDFPYGNRGRNGTLSEYAGFANATVYFGSTFDLTLGYRYSRLEQARRTFQAGYYYSPESPTDVERSAADSAEHPSTYLAAARYHVNDDVLLYARAASGYRPGGSRTVPVGAPAGFEDFYVSDSIWSYEGGVKVQALKGRLTLDADVYRIDWNNIQSLEPIPGTSFVTDGNAGRAVSKGFEFQTAYVPVRGLTVSANATYTDARFKQTVLPIAEEGQPLYYVPRWSAAASAEYSRPMGNAWAALLSADFAFQGSRLDTNRTLLVSSSTVNARVGLRSDRWQCTLYVRNLTGKTTPQGYFNGGNGLPYGFAWSTPRTWGIALRQML